MPKKSSPNLLSLSVDALLKLRDDLTRALTRRGEDLQRQLASLGVGTAGPKKRGRKPGTLNGHKVAAKYRGPDGELWSGRGRRPLWVAEALKGGSKREDYAIEGKAPAKRKKAGRKKPAS